MCAAEGQPRGRQHPKSSSVRAQRYRATATKLHPPVTFSGPSCSLPFAPLWPECLTLQGRFWGTGQGWDQFPEWLPGRSERTRVISLAPRKQPWLGNRAETKNNVVVEMMAVREGPKEERQEPRRREKLTKGEQVPCYQAPQS